MKKQLFIVSLFIALTMKLAAQVNFTSNDITNTPAPGAGFLPDPKLEQTPMLPIYERPTEINQKSQSNSLHQDIADPSEIFSAQLDPMAKYEPQRFDPQSTNFDKYQNADYVQNIGFDPSLTSNQQEEKYRKYMEQKKHGNNEEDGDCSVIDSVRFYINLFNFKMEHVFQSVTT
jgi:hypothetical protein